jgi:hypothetical protein
MAGIPVPEYKKLEKRFNPSRFDAQSIVKIAKDAGVKDIEHCMVSRCVTRERTVSHRRGHALP